MDISSNQSKKMKSKELRKIIREALLEVLSESPDPIAYGTDSVSKTNAKNRLKKTPKFNALKQPDRDDLFKGIDQDKDGGVINLEEDDLNEFANVGTLFQLNTDADISAFIDEEGNPKANDKGKISKKASIIAAMQDGEPVSQASVAKALGYDKQNPIDKDFRELKAANIIVDAETQLAQRFSRPAPSEEGDEDEEETSDGYDAEDFFVGSGLNLGTSKATPVDTDEEEPEIEPEKIEKVAPIKTRISDEDYQSFIKYSELRDRLNATKTNIAKEKRSTGAGEFMGNQSKEDRVKSLTNLKTSLEDRMAALVAGSKYLQDKIAKEQAGKAPKAPKLPEIEPVEDEDEDIVAENYEYERRQLQYRAGIIR